MKRFERIEQIERIERMGKDWDFKGSKVYMVFCTV